MTLIIGLCALLLACALAVRHIRRRQRELDAWLQRPWPAEPTSRGLNG